MILSVLLLLLLAAASRVELVDEVFSIPPSEWRYVDIAFKQQPVTVECDFEVTSGAGEVQAALLRGDDLHRLRANRPHGLIATSEAGSKGNLRYQLRLPGEYAVVVNNHAGSGQPSKVHLRVSLDFSTRPEPQVRYVSPQRQLVVILVSFAVFFAIVTYSARKLLRAIRR